MGNRSFNSLVQLDLSEFLLRNDLPRRVTIQAKRYRRSALSGLPGLFGGTGQAGSISPRQSDYVAAIVLETFAWQ